MALWNKSDLTSLDDVRRDTFSVERDAAEPERARSSSGASKSAAKKTAATRKSPRTSPKSTK